MYQTIGYFTGKNADFALQNHTNRSKLRNSWKKVNHDHIYSCSDPPKLKNSLTPFTTSRLQTGVTNCTIVQNKLCNYVKNCGGGYITYMRTDSTTYSEEFIKDIGAFIKVKQRKSMCARILINCLNVKAISQKKREETGQECKNHKEGKDDDKNAQEARSNPPY